jgi:hypothetical protein
MTWWTAYHQAPPGGSTGCERCGGSVDRRSSEGVSRAAARPRQDVGCTTSERPAGPVPAVSYHGVAVALAGECQSLEVVRELCYNTAVQARVHEILCRLRRGGLDPATALALLLRVEADTPRHPRWLAVASIGVAATALAAILGADAGATAVAGPAAGLGVSARLALARREVALLSLP